MPPGILTPFHYSLIICSVLRNHDEGIKCDICKQLAKYIANLSHLMLLLHEQRLEYLSVFPSTWLKGF